MKRDNSPWHPVTAADLDWGEFEKDQNGSPLSRQFGDVYYSRDNGMDESRYVFLEGNNLCQRLAQHRRDTFCIGETGFGTGLNFLLTWQLWQSLPSSRPRLHYLSVEKYPLTREDMRRALALWPDLAPMADSLLENYPPRVPGNHRMVLENGRLVLDLWWEDAGEALADIASRDDAVVDAWYLDGFAPAANESMWQRGIMEAIARTSRSDASFATYTAAGQVRRDLTAAGFDVQKVPGFGRKRECLRGVLKQRPSPPAPLMTPWDLPATKQAAPERVLVMGAGLAGCMTAAALARRGIAVTLLDRGALAGEGSGNEQGILYTRLSRRHSPLVDFALASFCFASRFYRQMLDNGQLTPGLDGELCGSFHQSDKEGDMTFLTGALAQVPDLGQVMDAQAATDVLGVEQPSGGYWFPGSGWLRPVSVCRALSSTGKLELLEHCGDVKLKLDGDMWLAIANDKIIAQAPCAVLATGYGAIDQPGLEWLPLQPIRGQTTQLPTTPSLSKLRTALCHEGYIAPARRGEHCIGATFDLREEEPELRTGDHLKNVQNLAAAVPAWRETLAQLDPGKLAGRVGYRCASPDYLPLVGPVPDLPVFLQDFASLRKNARQVLPTRGACLPGLYLNAAHGSRGLSSTPLAAEYLASTICGEMPPLGRELSRALAPARFIIRNLGRDKL